MSALVRGADEPDWQGCVVVIRATGHVGTYLVPRLVRAGHEVLALSRGEREPYRSAPEWRSVQRVAARVPVTEDEPRTANGEYGTGKAAIEALLHRETVAGGVPSVVLHPGHISGPGWPVITPAGNLDPDVWRRLATGEPLVLPDLGLGVLHHVHADDVAPAFERVLARPAAIGSSFHVATRDAHVLLCT
jgi:nucleoside-diphosphate-sugar epimerase